MPTADVQSRRAVAFTYTGALLDSNSEPLEDLSGLAASATFDGGAPTSTGITIEESDIPSHFDLEITATAMDIADRAVVTISATGAVDLVLTVRTGTGRPMSYGTPIDRADALAGGQCAETGLYCPASAMKELDGKRVADFVDFLTD